METQNQNVAFDHGILRAASVSSTLGALTTLLALFIFYRVIQARFFHPLSHFPGPFLNSISSIPAAYLVYKGTQPREFKKLHEKFGSVVRTGPNELSFIGADAWEDIYGVQVQRPSPVDLERLLADQTYLFQKVGANFQKDPAWLAVVSPKDGQTGVSMAPPETHTRQRNALGATFTNEALLTQEGHLRVHVLKFMDKLGQCARDDEAIDFSNWFTYLAFDIIGEVVFSEPFGCLDEGEATQWAQAINDIFKSGAWEQAFGQVAGVGTPLHKLMVKMLIPATPKLWRQKHLTGATDKTLRRLADSNRAHPDMIGHILRNNETKKARLSQTELVLNMVQFISAGSETTASLLTGWIYFLLSKPAVYQRVVKEVRDSFSSAEDITWANVGKLTYLEATVNEALRLVSPAPCNQHRVVPPSGEGNVIDGHFVPPGVTVAVAPWVAERHPENFTDPEKFEPERWLGAERYKHDKLHASQPFGLGVRACVGKNLSYFEARLLMGNLLWRFDLAFDQSEVAKEARAKWDEADMLVWHVWVKPPMLVKMTEVKR
ncbi:benzoate 4-monooxygenase cytochrome P450 [Aureobasidium pullulans]|uniref:Benzoate 4-monooxygenase cytochrome P450 n=1 Tax=Aureobasidium pullulans TaxID=5580 RepID=A0A4S9KIP3_AURPU|nr:benzoate 4-monooxygenase cytochrome P450 [Aureobasidium pullulans]